MAALIIFDLDGTIIDSRRDLADSTNEMLATYGAPALPIEQVAAMVGEGARVLVERALLASGLPPAASDALPRFLAIYDRRLLRHTRPYAGIAPVVRLAAARAALAVLTNKPEALSRRILEAFDLRPCFRWVIGGDASFPRKPDPASVRFLMTEAGATPAGTLLVGDSAIDVETATRAGVRVCVARYGFGRIDPDGLPAGADVAATPGEVGAAIARFLDAGGRG
ncbi:MAG TPA: HAD-IA family hydrolase [Vicinamibacterales bacterium]|nr:HAD-IA family hydrolase [Vicinamibacterales bacterium]